MASMFLTPTGNMFTSLTEVYMMTGEVEELVFRNFKFSLSPNLVHRGSGSGMGM